MQLSVFLIMCLIPRETGTAPISEYELNPPSVNEEDFYDYYDAITKRPPTPQWILDFFTEQVRTEFTDDVNYI